MKIITTGNPTYGLASGMNNVLNSNFASRVNGYNLSTNAGMDKFCQDAIYYDIVILNCYTEEMNNYSQARLLHKLYINWQKIEKRGHIICIGSISDHISTEQPWLKYISYGAEKLALKQLCQTINHNRENISPNIKCTYISLGHMHTPLVDKYHPDEIKLNTNYVAEVIKWIIDAPECIESITLTKDKCNG
jgi:NAD(P)-dependent dehydrogenase (short-subunit alcohol dehydrogenase family)